MSGPDPAAGSAQRHRVRDAVLVLFYTSKQKGCALLRADVVAALPNSDRRDVENALDWWRMRKLWGQPEVLRWTDAGWILTTYGEQIARERLAIT